ncbi:MAG TPA: isoprenylcysteine carboxylmethyltransferase family protein [Candidatus Paceibacterota bacterium]|nr:isoprenylcysteine carboxylmethyltransferase family protein [Candidatus Paceibacterota bacterium]
MTAYQIIILSSWAAFIVVWTVLSFFAKRDVRGGFSGFWKEYWALRIIVVIALAFAVLRAFSGSSHFANPGNIFLRGVFVAPPLLGWIAAVISVVGISFAVWARLHLGRNWSPRPAVKEHHELVTSGPYAYVRHPIYSGIILLAFGAAISGSLVGVIALVFASIVYLFRIRKEERIMLGLFPDQYPAYQARTKKLIPFVW